MATINDLGNITAICPGCNGGRSTFEHIVGGKFLGTVIKEVKGAHGSGKEYYQYKLFRCAGCGRGGLGTIIMKKGNSSGPANISSLEEFTPDTKPRLSIPDAVPPGIKNEFVEAETCFEIGATRAAAGLFRSVLDKTLRASGYKTKRESLEKQIDEAAKDGVITESRKRKAHEEIRVLGNDVLHDEWHPIPDEDVEAARHYTQRILEDFYDDRESVLKLLRDSNRQPEEDKKGKKDDDES